MSPGSPAERAQMGHIALTVQAQELGDTRVVVGPLKQLDSGGCVRRVNITDDAGNELASVAVFGRKTVSLEVAS